MPPMGEGEGRDNLHPRAPRAAQPEAQARLGQDHRAEPVQVEIFGFLIIFMLIDHKITYTVDPQISLY